MFRNQFWIICIQYQFLSSLVIIVPIVQERLRILQHGRERGPLLGLLQGPGEEEAGPAHQHAGQPGPHSRYRTGPISVYNWLAKLL